MLPRWNLTLAVLVAGLGVATVSGQGKKSDEVVKATAKVEKGGTEGKQEVTITLEIDPKYHIYGNPVGNEDFETNATTVTLKGKSKLEKVSYPVGEVKKDKTVGDYRIYKGKVTIKAVVHRAASESGGLEFAIKLQACTESSCLLPGTLLVRVP